MAVGHKFEVSLPECWLNYPYSVFITSISHGHLSPGQAYSVNLHMKSVLMKRPTDPFRGAHAL